MIHQNIKFTKSNKKYKNELLFKKETNKEYIVVDLYVGKLNVSLKFYYNRIC